MKRPLLLLLLLCLCFGSVAQTVDFTGSISTSANVPVSGASLVIKSGDNILAFGYSNEEGRYSISIERNDLEEVVLQVSSLGSEQQSILIRLTGEDKHENDFTLEDKVESLSTVVISSDKKIDLKRDTIVYKVSRFTDKTERTVEDVLKNIPGIEIDENGNIKAQGQNIQKILIEGDDLADSNYKIISQNLDAQVLDKVEVISNYDENPVLKQFLSSNAVVLNLKLQEKAKSVIFGNLEAGAGTENRYFGDLSLGLIRPEVKFLNLGNVNNIGKTAGDQLNNYIFGQKGFNDFDEDFETDNKAPVYLVGSSIIIDDKFYVENRSIANNLLLNKTIKEKTKLRSSLYFYDEYSEKENLSIFQYFIEPKDILFTEKNYFAFDNLNFSNDIEISHTFSEDGFLNFKNNFRVLNENVQNLVLFNNEERIDQQLKDRNIDLESNLKYTRKIKGGAAIFYLYLGSKNLQQDFVISPDTFSTETVTSDNVLHSRNKSNVNYQGLQGSLVFKKNRLSYSFAGNLMHSSEELDFRAVSREGPKETIKESMSGNNDADSYNAAVRTKAKYQLSNRTNMNANVEAVYVNYEMNRVKEDFLLLNPDVSFATKTSFGNIRLTYSYLSELPRLYNFTDSYVVRSYRNLYLGTDELEPIRRQRYSLNYTFSRPEKRILFTSSISYTDYYNQLTTQNQLSRDLNISQALYTSGQNFLLFNSGFTTYVDELKNTLKIGLTHTVFENPAIINYEELLIQNQSSNLYFRGTSYFRGIYNFKFSATYGITRGEIQGNEVINDRYNFRLENIFRINNKIFANIENEIFIINSELYESSTANLEYRPRESDWVFGLRAQNLFNTEDYVFANVSDYQQSEIVFKAVPRYVLLYGKIRF